MKMLRVTFITCRENHSVVRQSKFDTISLSLLWLTELRFASTFASTFAASAFSRVVPLALRCGNATDAYWLTVPPVYLSAALALSMQKEI